MATFPEPVFFDTDETVILAECTSYYEGLVGKKLSPAQSEQMIINAFAYREKMLRIAGNEAAKQMLVDFAVYPMLDYLGALLNVERLPAASAECTVQFTMVTGHPSLLIPAGVRVQSTDGKIVFVTLADVTVGTGVDTVTVIAESNTEGIVGNNYQPGDISIILDPQAFVIFCANIDITNGGTDQESDEALRARIKLAPSSFSVAGPDDAYIFFAKSANPGIIDVSITSPNPGDVAITALMLGGVVPSSEVQGQILAKCNPEKVRPNNDNVYILNPTAVTYALTVELTLLTDAVESAVLDLVNANLLAYTAVRKTRLGVDVVISQIKGKCMVDGVYDCNVVLPTGNIAISKTQFASCTGISVTITGESEA